MACRASSAAGAAVAATALALALLAATAAAAGESAAVLPAAPVDDAAVLQELQQALAQADPAWASIAGWDVELSGHPCTWTGVLCDAHQRVTSLRLVHVGNVAAIKSPSAAAAAASPFLLPQLAQLEFLETLLLIRKGAPPWGRLPDEWLAPGAFRRLTWLSLAGSSLAGPLPAFRPGVLPRLQVLELEFPFLHSALPPSWGADLAVLPSLRELTVDLQLDGGLPAEWAEGFRQLRKLAVLSSEPFSRNGSYRAAPASTPGPRLPAEWAAGFPSLEFLSLSQLPISGPLPQSWQDGGFPSLMLLQIASIDLLGSLPPQLFKTHPRLVELSLHYTHMTGTLPGTWSSAQVMALQLTANLMTGPAFPPAWLRPGALPRLEKLDLMDNIFLAAGTLPPSLPWPKLTSLRLMGVPVNGTVPETWCRAPFADALRELSFSYPDGAKAFPPCASTTFRSLEPKPWLQGKRGGSRSASSEASASPLRLGMLAAAGVASAAVAAICLLRRRRSPQRDLRHSPPGSQGMELLRLLSGLSAQLSLQPAGQAAQRQGAASSPAAARHMPAEPQAAGVGLTRRDRLEALLNSEVGQGGPVAVRPVEAMHKVLAHELLLELREGSDEDQAAISTLSTC